MTKTEAKRILDLDSLANSRAQSRIFGNIDSSVKPLSASDMISLTMTSVDFCKKVAKIFDGDNLLYRALTKREKS